MGCPFLLQGIFPTQGLNSNLLYWLVNSLSLSHQGSIHTIITTQQICFTLFNFPCIYNSFKTKEKKNHSWVFKGNKILYNYTILQNLCDLIYKPSVLLVFWFQCLSSLGEKDSKNRGKREGGMEFPKWNIFLISAFHQFRKSFSE